MHFISKILNKSATSLSVVAFSFVGVGCSTILPGTTSLSSNTYDSKINVIDLASYSPQIQKKLDVSDMRNIELSNYEYRVGSGDVLSVVVYDHPELTIPAGGFRSPVESGSPVHADGTLYFPYVGNVHVAGLSVIQIRKLLSQKLSKYIESPQVDVRVAAFRSQSAYISGAVKKVGPQVINNIPLTLVDALSNAGGVSELGDTSNVTVARQDGMFEYSLDDLYEHGVMSQNILLQHGDVVNVQLLDEQKVFVLGEVGKQQIIEIKPKQVLSLTEAIAGSGGLDLFSADASGVFVIRKSGDRSKLADVYQLDLSQAVAFIKGTQFLLEKNDVVYVTTAPISQWNRLLAQLIPSLSGTNSILDTALSIKSLSN